jgi:eukaryotic-like serine/threonine-protein kinase
MVMENGTRLDELLDRWEEQRDQQQPVAVEDLCCDCPELLGDLKKRIEALEFMDALYSTSKVPGGQDTANWQLGSKGSGDFPKPREMATTSHYQVERFHAKGGLGEVVLARDAVLHREVALKLIQRPHDRVKQNRDRFLREAKITGLLEHPGIVPVYGEGITADGRPFYAMRFIHGESLQQAIEDFYNVDGASRNSSERTVGSQKLLRRFVDVCNTIEYAHSRGVIHRDLKPANVMLGKYGETLVVDWGLAKSLGPASSEAETGGITDDPLFDNTDAPTQAGAAVGTPAYMSPEQAAGQVDKLGPATDIYSLGATLYCVLTGRAPFADRSDRGVLAILKGVSLGDSQTPRQVNPLVPRPLEAICLKAMALRPADRYASALALADDIEHWLADESVSARPDSLRERGTRWARHHRSWTLAGMVTLLIAMATLSVATVLVNQQRRVAEGLADEKAKLAETEQGSRQRADEQSQLALGTLKSVVFDIQSKLAGVSGAQEVRKNLLNTAIAGLEKVARSLDATPQADDAMIWSHLDLGDTFLLVGGDKGSSATELARQQYESARKTAQKLVDNNPRDAQAQRDLSASYAKLGDANLQSGNAPTAFQYYEKKLKITQQLADADPHAALEQGGLLASYTKLGDVSLRLGNVRTARGYYEQSFEIALAWVDPHNAQTQRDLSIAYSRLGMQT